ncbi:MAG TPA: glycosyltransferase family 4 protein [Methylophilaceae bacterium]|nr:glycosyltransferase family 4 protein [Methylophilaceae bacterium]
MRVLFIHQNFPGQFRHIAGHWAANPANQVLAIGQKHAPGMKSVPMQTYERARDIQQGTHHYLAGAEQAVLNAQGVIRLCAALQAKGFVPDLVIGHAGWGEMLYIKDIFPNARLINYFEFFYRATGADTDFDPEFPMTMDDRLRIRTKNAVNLLSLDGCDAGVTPTRWQHSTYPPEYARKIAVIHEGIDTELAKPDAEAQFVLQDGRVLTRDDEVVTYVARNLEPYRGFHVFMRAAEKICQRRPNAHILVIGGDEVSYGSRLPDGRTYRQKMLEEVKLDLSRVHFLGKVPYRTYLQALQVSSAHVYLTVPFVLSWSMLEAMATQCTIISSNTPPVTELIRDGENGLLADFFSPEQIAEQVDRVLKSPIAMAKLGVNARADILNHYTIKKSIQRYEALLKRLGID